MRKISRLLLLAVAVMMIATSAHAANLAAVQVFTDPAADNVTTEDVSPVAASDLVAGFIAETDNSIDLTWQVAGGIQDAAVPQPEVYYFEFQLTAPDGSTGLFSARAVLTPTAGTGGANPTYPSGRLQGNCTTTGTLVTCVNVPGAVVTVSVDPTHSSVTASLRRQDLKSNEGAELAVDGTELDEAVLFRGIAACVTTPAVTPSATCDEADLDDAYTLGSPR